MSPDALAAVRTRSRGVRIAPPSASVRNLLTFSCQTQDVDRSDEQVAHEDGLALFIEPMWRSRFRESLGNERRRRKLVGQLDHFRHLDMRYATRILSRQQDAQKLAATLRRGGASDRCWVMSSDEAVDCRALKLRDALAAIDGGEFGTFISCVPGRLAYFHGEEIDERYVLERHE